MTSKAYFGAISEPCCINEPKLCHKQLWKVSVVSSSSDSVKHGCGVSHSYGVSLQLIKQVRWSGPLLIICIAFLIVYFFYQSFTSISYQG